LGYKKKNKFTLVSYLDAYFVEDVNDRTFTSCYLMNMGSTIVSWSCRKQTIVENSSTETKYISPWKTSCEVV
jgi:hypothetical protein